MDQNDVLSDVFQTLRLSSDLYFRAELGGRFSIEVPPEARRIRFHLLRLGSCWVDVPGVDPVQLAEGDVALVPEGVGHVLSAEPGLSPSTLAELVGDGRLSSGVLTHGVGGRGASLLCGFCRFDESLDHPILIGMPSLLVLQSSKLGAEPWLSTALRLLQLETDLDTHGTAAVLGRLLDIIMIQTTRRTIDNLEGTSNGFLAALIDPALSKALAAIHRSPEREWRVTDLARKAAMSRARFAKRFADRVGVPPIDYLTEWRLMKARTLLATTQLDMNDIAAACGYRSVPSFSRRFKIRFSEGPGSYRRSAR